MSKLLEQLKIFVEKPVVVDEELRYWLCRATLVALPNAQQKITEVVDGYEMNMKVNMKPYGADLISDQGKTLELKRSRVHVRSNGNASCSIMWNVLEGKTLAEKKQRMKDHLREISSIGYVRFILIHPDGNVLKTYDLSNRFMECYFDGAIHYNTKKFNMGSTVCLKCGTCPRLDRMKQFEDQQDISILFRTKLPPHYCRI